MSAAIRFRDLTLGYDRHPAVHHLDGDVESGALLAICGPNGAGKSTLLKGIAGSLNPLSGAVALPHVKARDIAYLPQAADIDRSFPINVFDVVAMGLWARCGLFGAIARRELTKVESAIAAVGLEGFELRAISTLSGGQLQLSTPERFCSGWPE
jgi:zinc/manganese transport system ATP-binding protein